MEIVATNVVASRPPNGDRLQCRPLVPIKTAMLCHCHLEYLPYRRVHCPEGYDEEDSHQQPRYVAHPVLDNDQGHLAHYSAPTPH